jgi:hypothetical protein
MPTAFEWQLRRLGLSEQTCVHSKKLREWCESNKDRVYIPEWLLKQWGMSVDPSLSNVSAVSPRSRSLEIRFSPGKRRAQALYTHRLH